MSDRALKSVQPMQPRFHSRTSNARSRMAIHSKLRNRYGEDTQSSAGSHRRLSHGSSFRTRKNSRIPRLGAIGVSEPRK
jgi:hypothetical protein